MWPTRPRPPAVRNAGLVQGIGHAAVRAVLGSDRWPALSAALSSQETPEPNNQLSTIIASTTMTVRVTRFLAIDCPIAYGSTHCRNARGKAEDLVAAPVERQTGEGR